MKSLTFDIDWAPDEVVQHCLDILGEADVRATFFATHRSKLIDTIESFGHELGIHPNFMPNFHGKGKPYRETIDELMAIFPQARGVRFHSLGYSAPVLDYCFQSGIKYDSSVFLPFQAQPYLEYTGIRRIPFIESDLQTVIDQSGFAKTNLLADSSLPFVYVFHPIHVFLNTYSMNHYSVAKEYYHEPEALLRHRNRQKDGVETMLVKILESNKPANFLTTGEIYNMYKETERRGSQNKH